MATEWSDSGEEFSLPDEFLDDDFFSEEEKAAVAARSESDEEDSLASLSRRLAGILGDTGDRKRTDKEEVTVGSPQSTLCGLPKSGQETPNDGASKGNSPPSSPLEQRPADPWELLYEAAGQVARMRAGSSVPVPSNAYGFTGHAGAAFSSPARKPSPPPPVAPPPAVKAPAGGYYHPFAHIVTQRQMQAAQVRCSTVLVPARVVQALNLNLDDLGAQPCYPGGFVLDHDALISRSNAMLASQKRRAAAVGASPALCQSS
ncbi:hypothetical protein EJB05_58118 [Eragrostis curvula]|uniref:Uncharacterized protein n=1 Tax=Eragrostis curvula TaxID=38414 RepID=A0A5J9SEE2_9POAL|nr:hypothetical protein EJB05_58118 [Eragrostis curvula]